MLPCQLAEIKKKKVFLNINFHLTFILSNKNIYIFFLKLVLVNYNNPGTNMNNNEQMYLY